MSSNGQSNAVSKGAELTGCDASVGLPSGSRKSGSTPLHPKPRHGARTVKGQNASPVPWLRGWVQVWPQRNMFPRQLKPEA